MTTKHFNSNGKLLISAEYLVLDGAQALAIPTKYGQSLKIETINKPKIVWKSFDSEDNIWYENTFSFDDITSENHNENQITKRLFQIIKATRKLNPEFLKTNKGIEVTTKLDFPRQWGLGTSSTLINNIAQWAKIDPYKLLENTFGGSGYDIACAQNSKPITYQITHNKPTINNATFNPTFKEHLYFVYLNKKQNSRDGIAHYKAHRGDFKDRSLQISNITSQMILCESLEEFEQLIIKHEEIISQVTKQTPVKNLLFSDFNGEMKSLGAWGGDFILVTSKVNPITYFNDKGFSTVIRFTDMIL